MIAELTTKLERLRQEQEEMQAAHRTKVKALRDKLREPHGQAIV
jgi:hypothetical protein